MTRLALPCAALLAGVAAWLSQGTLAVASLDGPRIALLPISAAAVVIAVLVAIAVAVLGRSGASLAPVALLTLVILPWLPMPLPAALLVWSGSIAWLVWLGVGILLLLPAARQLSPRIRSLKAATLVQERPRLSAGLLAFALFALSAWMVSPSVPGGDEPHYLVITQSLLLDGDLKIENNHRSGDYHAYYAGQLSPHYIRRGRGGEIYSIHAPGLSVLVAPAFAVGGYRAVVLFLLIVSACGSA